MEEVEAASIMCACALLSDKLRTQGIDCELSQEDRASLAGFNLVRLSKWFTYTPLYMRVGLTPFDINNLVAVATRIKQEELKTRLARNEFNR